VGTGDDPLRGHETSQGARSAGLVITRREGREKLHYLNAVPIRQIYDRWMDKFREHQVSALIDLKNTLEERDTETKKWNRRKTA
jgi:hypothetical protein